jgi:hypothetical protein
MLEATVRAKENDMRDRMKAGNRNRDIEVDPGARSVFLHIPKTGGTGLKAMFKRLEDLGYEIPALVPHGINMAKVEKKFDHAVAHFLLRDPIERAASGFLSRMRMGRPVHNYSWDVGEAVAYSFFKTPQEWFAALIGEDERMKSAAIFAYENISHLARNYVFYFESVSEIERLRNRIGLVGEIERTDDFIRKLVAEIAPGITDISTIYEKTHVSAVRASSATAGMSPAELEKLRTFFAPEYEIYEHLKRMVNC